VKDDGEEATQDEDEEKSTYGSVEQHFVDEKKARL
jgi:hypothetical protein